MPYGLQLDELQVVSDLHLGGRPGFQIFASGPELVWLADSVAQSKTAGLAALLINGDFIDFLAEEPALAFDPDGAIAKLDRVMADPAFAPVFAAFARLLATPKRLLAINLGNHDLELALPWVRRHLVDKLTGGDTTAASRLLLVTDGAGFACSVGTASVLCLHGNEVDSWNVTDFERLRRIGRDTQFGLAPAPWTPNAGAQLVVEAMNQIKRDYPFVDLLKPENAAVAPILAALNPQLLTRLQDLTGVASRKAVDMVRMGLGFLDADLPAGAAAGGSSGGPAAVMPDSRWMGAAMPVAAPPGGSARALMDRAEQAYAQGVPPMTLVYGNQGEQLGVWGAAWAALRGKPAADVLRETLDYLDTDQSFDVAAPDDTFKAIDALVAPEIDLVLAGHTHLERTLRRQRGFGHYFNSGTWARLMRITPAVRQDPVRFGAVFKLLNGSRIETLEQAEPELVLRRNTVISIWRDPDGATQAELRHVGRDPALPGKFQALPVTGTRHTAGRRS